jgi:hypothetical protein
MDNSDTIDSLLFDLYSGEGASPQGSFNLVPTYDEPKPTKVFIIGDENDKKISIKKEKQIKSLTSQLIKEKTVAGEKKWIIALFIAAVVILLCSSFTVMALDRFVSKTFNFEIFSEISNKNEFTLMAAQFIIILFVVRLILKYY